jgi:hypothetical protein
VAVPGAYQIVIFLATAVAILGPFMTLERRLISAIRSGKALAAELGFLKNPEAEKFFSSEKFRIITLRRGWLNRT